MIKELLRTLGFGCLVAGGVLYLGNGGSAPADVDITSLQEQLSETEEELTRTKEALALAQTASSTDTKPTENNKELTAAKPADVVETSDQTEGRDQTVKTVLTIQPGSNSTIVSGALERLGIIDNASEFDRYLASQGLAGKIQIGEHELDSTMDFKTLAKKITSAQ